MARVGFLILCRRCRFRKWWSADAGDPPDCPRCEANDWHSAAVDEPRRALDFSRDDRTFLKSYRIRAD
jgi:hypothetical protein